jgi:hypothetical protein
VSSEAHSNVILPDSHNMRAALDWSIADGDFSSAARVALASVPLWAATPSEGRRYAETILASRDPLGRDVVCRLLLLRGWAAAQGGDWSTTASSMSEIIEIASGVDDFVVAAHAFLALINGFVLGLGNEHARKDFEHHLAAIDAGWDACGAEAKGWATMLAAVAMLAAGDAASSASWLERGLSVLGEYSGRNVNRADARALYATTLHLLGRYEESLQVAELAAAERTTWREFSGSTDYGRDLGPGSVKILALATLGRTAEARTYAEDLIAGVDESSLRVGLGQLLTTLAATCAQLGDHVRSARLLGASEGVVQLGSFFPLAHRYAIIVTETLGAEEFERLRAEGRSLRPMEAIAHGLEGLS